MSRTKVFAKRVRQLRLEKGVPQQQVADALGISKPGYQNYEYGNKTPSFAVLPLLADYFNVSADYLLGRSDDPRLPRMDEETKKLFLAFRALKGNAGTAQ